MQTTLQMSSIAAHMFFTTTTTTATTTVPTTPKTRTSTTMTMTTTSSNNSSSSSSSNNRSSGHIATLCTTSSATTPKATVTTTTTGTISTASTVFTASKAKTASNTAPTRRTTITSDPGILCFHHCNVKVFCFTLPHICPNCKTKFDTTGDDADGDVDGDGDGDGDNRNSEDDGASVLVHTRYERNFVSTTKALLPFRLPYPFVRASQYPCAIVLRPTTGDFLNDYNNATDLHIAVTTSTGTVVEFDRHGLRQHRAENMPEWWQCLMVGDVPEPWYDYWDEILLQICKQSARWSTSAYHEDTHNCYTFVLAFLQALSYDKLSAAAQSKTTFCEKYIVPRTTTAGKYISLYRKLRDTGGGIYVHSYTSKRHTNQQSSRNKVRGYIKPPALILPTMGSNAHITNKKTTTTTRTTNSSSSSSIMVRSPALCTIEE